MFSLLTKLFKKDCYLCSGKRRNREFRNYVDDRGQRIKVCLHCVEYAGRRAFKKV